jgi:hypothetical protein
MDDLTSEDRDLSKLARIIRAEHIAVGEASANARAASANALGHGMAAGDALIAVRSQLRRGTWLTWLKENCRHVSRSTALLYIQLAEHRADLDAHFQCVGNSSIGAARRFLSGDKTKTAKPSQSPLSAHDWLAASPEMRSAFLAQIGLPAVLGAMPPAWRLILEERIAGVRSRPGNKSPKASLALRQALSLAKTITAAGISSEKPDVNQMIVALNQVVALFAKDGVDLTEIDVTAPKARRRAA